jgi:putative tricarboxylic transport membrane protein
MSGFIPLLSLGIPTSPALAIVLGTLVMNGLQPGPTLFLRHGELAFTVIASMVISNAMLLVLSLPLIGLWARISLIPYRILGPIVIAICLIGAYAPRNTMFDVAVAIVFGVVGYLMRRLDWPLAPLILGFLMGPLLEQSLRQTLGISNGDISILFTRPIPALAIAAAAVIAIGTTYLKHRSKTISTLINEGANEV